MIRFLLALITLVLTAQASYSQTILTDTQTRTSLKLITAFEERGELLNYSKSEIGIWKQKYIADSISRAKTIQAATMLNKACEMQGKQLKKEVLIWKSSAIFISTLLLATLLIK